MDFEKGSVAGKTGSERGEPPLAIGDTIFEGGLKSEKAGGATHISMAAEDFRAVLGIPFVERKFGAQGGKHVAAACMPDPARDIFLPKAGPIKNGAGMLRGQRRNLGGQKIAQKAGPMVEAEIVPVFRGQVGG